MAEAWASRILAGFTVLSVAGLAGGCVGPLVDTVDVSPQVEQSLVTRVPVFMIGQDPPPASLIGPVEATSCMNKVWDPAASQDNALAQLRLKASQLGGTAVANVACGSDGTDLATNCWQSVNCRGTAIILKGSVDAKKEPEDPKKSVNAEDKALCLEFGYKPGTKEYASCRENLHQKRDEAEQAALARQAAAQQAAAANQAAIAGAIIAKGPIYVPPPPQQTYQPVPTLKLPRPVTTTCRQDPVLKGNVTCTSQ